MDKLDLIISRTEYQKKLRNNTITNYLWTNFLIYIVLPIIGAILGISIYQLFL